MLFFNNKKTTFTKIDVPQDLISLFDKHQEEIKKFNEEMRKPKYSYSIDISPDEEQKLSSDAAKIKEEIKKEYEPKIEITFQEGLLDLMKKKI